MCGDLVVGVSKQTDAMLALACWVGDYRRARGTAVTSGHGGVEAGRWAAGRKAE